ncbi:MAG: hypothetical protein ABID38_04860 [Candidatus Diapherotrites archaeon]
MISRRIFSILVLILLFASVSAVVSDLPSYITIRNSPMEISFTVSNPTSLKKALDVEVFSPVSYQVTEKAQWVDPNSSETVKIKFIPRGDLIGTRYAGKIIVTLGSEKTEHEVSFFFTGEDSCPVKAAVSKIESEEDGIHSIKLFVYFKNDSVEEQEVGGISLEGIPGDWSYSGEETLIVPAQGNAETTLEISPGSSFNGEAEFVYSCRGFENREKVNIEHEGSAGITGLFGALDLELFSVWLLVDLFLFVVAAILLIAFIARFIKRVK